MIRFSSILIVFVLGLTACVRPQNHRTDSSATFILAEVKAKSAVSEYREGFSLPSARLYNFSVCASDLRNRESLARSEFTVSGGENEITKRTDDSGCLNWSETVRYDYLDDEHYIDFKRKVTAHGMSNGSREVHLAINPWNITKAGDEVYDLNFKQLPDSLSLTATNSATPKQMWISKIYVENTPVQSKDFITRKLRGFIQPSILLKDVTGHQTVLPLTEAKLKISVDVIGVATAGGVESSFVVTSQKDLQLVKDGDNWSFEFNATLRQNNANLRYQWAIRLDPIGTPSNLKSFSGLFSAGDTSAMTGSASIPMSLRDGNYQPKAPVGELLASVTAAREQTQGAQNAPVGAGLPSPSVDPTRNQGAKPGTASADYIAQTKTFEFSEIKPEFLGVVSETATTRTIRYRGNTCVIDNTNGGHAAIDVDFKVEAGQGSDKHALKVTKRRGGGLDGCIAWEDTITHRYYEPEHFVVIPFTFTHEASGFTETRTVEFNPWDRLNFAVDDKIGKDVAKTFNDRAPVKARMIVDGYQFDTIKTRSYGVDSFLNLRILKKVQFRISVRVQRHSSMLAGKAAGTEPLRDGIYVFRSLVDVNARSATGETTELFSPMVGRQKLVRVIGGDVKAYGEFNLGDPKLMRARANLLFEILPVDESKLSEDEKSNLALLNNHSFEDVIDRGSGLITPTFVGPVWAGDEGGFATVFPTDLPISGTYKSIDMAENTKAIAGQTYSQVMERAKASQQDYIRRMSEMRALPNYLKTQNLEYVALSNEATVQAANPGLAENNLYLPKTGAVDRLLAFMNYKIPDGTRNGVDQRLMLPEAATAQTMLDLIEGRSELDQRFQVHLCQMFMTDIVGKTLPNAKAMFQDCLMTAASQQPLFVMDRIVRVVESDGGQFVSTDQPTLSFSLGADLGFGRSASKGISWSPLAVINSIPIVSSVWGALGLSASVSYGTSGSEGSHFGSGTSLTMENVGLDIKATRYETCAAIRIAPAYWEARKYRFSGAKLAGDALAAALSRGVMICSGTEAIAPMSLHEKFYSFSQGVSDGTLLDKGDVGNMPWLISLRSVRDYVTFMSFVQAKNGLNKNSALGTGPEIDVGGYSLDRLKDAYAHYRSHIGAQPGFYVFPAEAEKKEARAWWDPRGLIGQ